MRRSLVALFVAFLPSPADTASWSVTELHYQRGPVAAPTFAGVEWLFWMNKLGDEATDENRGLFLLVWRL